MSAGTKHRITINLAEDEHQRLSVLAQKNRVSLAWLGRQAIVEFLNRHDEERQLPLQLLAKVRKADV